MLLSEDLVGYLRGYVYTALGGVASSIAEITESRDCPDRIAALTEGREHFEATGALLDALGWRESEPSTDVELDEARCAWPLRETIAIALSVENDRLNEYDTFDSSRKTRNERNQTVKHLSALRQLKWAMDRE